MTMETMQASTMQQLRVVGAAKAKSMGIPTTELRTRWSREQIENFLMTGESPQIGTGGGNVNVDKAELAGVLIELLEQVNSGKGNGVDVDAVREIVREELKDTVKTIQVKALNGLTTNIGLIHYCFEEVLLFASQRIDVMLVGAAGSGKTTTCHKVADALAIEFYAQSVGAQTTTSNLIGYMDAMGKYVETMLYQAYKNGGVYLLDEIDAGNANVLTALNALLANGSYRFPNGECVSRHADFICIAAGNTMGRGANRSYVGRNQLDAATLDRFCVIEHDYDETLERQLAGNDEWTLNVQRYRHAAEALGERVIISPRASMKGAVMIKAGMKWKRAEETIIWKGIDETIKNKIIAKAANC